MLMLRPSAVSAQDGQSYTQDELRALPRVCLAQRYIHRRLRFPIVPEAERKQWAAKLGASYNHYHHYCVGLIFMRRAAADASASDYNYRSAASNFQYVIRNASNQFVLLPEVYLRKGSALRFLGKHGAAATEFLNAIRLKSNYTPAYAALVELHVDLGDLESARDVLETGLRHAPDSKILAQVQENLREQEANARD